MNNNSCRTTPLWLAANKAHGSSGLAGLSLAPPATTNDKRHGRIDFLEKVSMR
jgi:hypothetical protein